MILECFFERVMSIKGLPMKRVMYSTITETMIFVSTLMEIILISQILLVRKITRFKYFPEKGFFSWDRIIFTDISPRLKQWTKLLRAWQVLQGNWTFGTIICFYHRFYISTTSLILLIFTNYFKVFTHLLANS